MESIKFKTDFGEKKTEAKKKKKKMILGKRNIYIYDTFCIWYFVCKTMGFWCFNSGWRVQTRNEATEIDRCFPCSNLLKTAIPKIHIWSARSPSIRKRAHLRSTFYTWSNNKARELELPKPLYCISVRCHKNYKERKPKVLFEWFAK